MIYLNKLIPIFISPLFFILFLLFIGLLTRRRWPLVLALLGILLCANPYLARQSRAYLEQGYTYTPVQFAESGDVVVVLSGMLNAVADAESKIHYEFNGSVNRFEAGLKFLQQNKVAKLVFTRGHLPWSKGRPEGEILAEIAVNRGVPPEKILLTDIVQNTDDEARAVRKLIGEKQKLVLVTSAFHMPRAQRVFEAQGLNVLPHPVNFNGAASAFMPIDILPTAAALSLNSFFIREMIGRTYYALKY